jgi:hypothetical protein
MPQLAGPVLDAHWNPLKAYPIIRAKRLVELILQLQRPHEVICISFDSQFAPGHQPADSIESESLGNPNSYTHAIRMDYACGWHPIPGFSPNIRTESLEIC